MATITAPPVAPPAAEAHQQQAQQAQPSPSRTSSTGLRKSHMGASMANLMCRDGFDCKVPHDLTLSIVVLGASGDLAKKKTYPALYALYSKG
jgi:hypothetical protein